MHKIIPLSNMNRGYDQQAGRGERTGALIFRQESAERITVDVETASGLGEYLGDAPQWVFDLLPPTNDEEVMPSA